MFTAQRLYDLALKANDSATESDLDHFAFLLEGFNIGWLRPLLAEDAPRLALLVEPPASPLAVTQAMLRCSAKQSGEYAQQLASAVWNDGNAPRWATGAAVHVERRKQESTKAIDTSADSVAQRLYDLATACDVVATDYMIGRLAEVLHRFQPDALDREPLIQDAPRLQAALRKLAPSADFVRRYGAVDTTSTSEFHSGLHAFEFDLRLNRGVCSAFSGLLKELFGQHGLTKDSSYSDLEAALRARNTPHKLEVERRGRRSKYTCVYVWMIEDNSYHGSRSLTLTKPLVDSAKNWDKELVASIVQACVEHPGEKLLKFIVCVANDRNQAKALAEQYNSEWRDFSKGHLSGEMDVRDARHVILLNADERPRAVFVWGTESHWQAPGGHY